MHNLQHVDVTLPHQQMTVFCGLVAAVKRAWHSRPSMLKGKGGMSRV